MRTQPIHHHRRARLAGLALVAAGATVAATAAIALGGGASQGAATGRLELDCPPTAKLRCSSGVSPDTTGHAVATSSVDPAPLVAWTDTVVQAPSCPTERFDEVIVRRWRAVDDAGNAAECDQPIHVVKDELLLDIKPTSCPNPLRVGSQGEGASVSMALVGRPGQPVADIVPGSIELWREHCVAGPLAPLSVGLEDVVAPHAPTQRCECGTAGPDGVVDLRLSFSRQQMIDALLLAAIPNGSLVPLVVTGTLANGCRFRASDCVLIRN